MNFEQCEERNKRVMLNAIEWANGRNCEPLTYEDMAIICCYLSMSVSKHFHNHFFETSGINHAKVSGAEKTIYKTLDKIQEKLLSYDISKLSIEV